MKRAILLSAAAMFLLAGCNAPMPQGNWSDAPYKALCALMEECKAEAAEAGRNVNYAIFDYDNTTVLQDVEQTFTLWQLENLRFNFTPDELWDIFASCIPDLDIVLAGAGAENVTARMLLTDIESDYRAIITSVGVSCGNELSPQQLATIQAGDYLRDFKIKFWGLYEGVMEAFGYDDSYPLLRGLNHGMDYDEFAALAREGISAHVSKKQVRKIHLESPDMGMAGKVSVVVPDGLALTREMRLLYKALPENGIDVYIFSASLEALVEQMACNPQYLGLDTLQVFGFRMEGDSTGMILQVLKPGYIQPYREGKTGAIKAYIAPQYGGKDPVLVAGDSNGDYSMLTSFPDMRVGLIVDKGQTVGGIADLRRQALEAESGGAPSNYVLQRRADPRPEFKRK